MESSNKRHLLLTGDRGTGKTALLRQLFSGPQPGLTTWAEPGKAVFLRENATGEQRRIGVFDPGLPGPENRMRPEAEGFDSLGVPALTRCGECEDRWITIDEIGYLEGECSSYLAALEALFEKKNVAAILRKQALPCLQTLRRREDAFLVDLDKPFGNLGCVIMASGLGKRFGGNKLMADFHGEPMLCRILKATEGIFARRVVVTRHEEVARLCEDRGIRTILHSLPYRSDTVRLGLETMADMDGCMFCPGDQPLLSSRTVAALALNWVNAPTAIWRVRWGEEQGAPVIFPRWAFPGLLELPEGKGGGEIIKKYPERLRWTDIRDKYEIKDVDSLLDMKELLER